MLNNVTLTGNLGSTAETKTTQSGKTFMKFTLAFNSQNGKETHTKWVRCTVWSPAMIERYAQRLVKGTRVIISGRPSFRTWADQSGVSHEEFEVSVNDLDFVQKNAVQPVQAQPVQAVPQPMPQPVQAVPQPVQAVQEQWPTVQVQPAYSDENIPF